LTQGYVLVALGGILIAAAARRAALLWMLAPLAVISGYAAIRGIVGPTDGERVFALTREGVPQYGGAFRNVGSFSGAVGLASYLVPAAVCAFALALLRRELRVPAAVVFVASTVAIVTSYTRAALAAVALGVLLAMALSLRRGSSRRAKLLAIGVTVATLVVGGFAAVVVSSDQPRLRERIHAFVDPLGDRSVRLRLTSWKNSLSAIAHHPLGTGLGTVGRASSSGEDGRVTTDNSYLKVFREQGIVPGAAFVFGLIALCAACIRSQRQPGVGAVGIAACAGFAAFLVLSGAGEYIEQPGKVLAWTLLGVALWNASVLDERGVRTW